MPESLHSSDDDFVRVPLTVVAKTARMAGDIALGLEKRYGMLMAWHMDQDAEATSIVRGTVDNLGCLDDNPPDSIPITMGIKEFRQQLKAVWAGDIAPDNIVELWLHDRIEPLRKRWSRSKRARRS